MSRPVLLTVDDDPASPAPSPATCAAATARTTGSCAPSPARDALDALRELKLRGEPVAVLLADYRMPEMNGIEFLEQAMDLVPARPAGAAHRLRRHRRRDPRDQRRRRRPLPAQAVGPAGGEALPGRRRAARGVARASADAAGRRDQGGRPPLVGRVVRGARLPGPQPGALPLVRRRRAGGRSGCSAAAGRRRRTTCRWWSRRTARRWSRPTDAELAAAGRADHRPRRPTSTTSSSIGGGPAGLGAAVYGASEGLRTVLVERAGHRRPGRAELPDRELPRLPRRRVRRPAHRPGPAAGGEVRRRGAHRPRRRRAGGQRLGPRRAVRRRQRDRRARGGPRHRGVLPAARRARASPSSPAAASSTARRSTEAPACAGQDVYIVGGANSAGQAAVFFSRHAQVGDAAGARAVAGGVDVALPDRAARGDRQHRACAPAPRSSRRSGDEHLERLDAARRPRPASTETVDAGLAVRVHRRRSRAPTGSTASLVRDEPRLRPHRPGPARRRASRPPGWPLDRDPYHLETSVPGVFVAGDVRADSVKRVASAVGEGAMAVTLVHRYLEEPVTTTADRQVRMPAGRAARRCSCSRTSTTSSWTGCASTATSSRSRPAHDVVVEGDPASCFYVLLAGTIVDDAGGSAATTSRSTAPTSRGVVRRRRAVLPRRPSRRSVYRRTVRAITDATVLRAAAPASSREVVPRTGSRWRCTC